MPINALIAQGIEPLGQGVPQTLQNIQRRNQLDQQFALQSRQADNQNALAQAQLGQITRQNAMQDKGISDKELADNRTWAATSAQILSTIKDPAQFAHVADSFAADPRAAKLGIKREMITPESVPQFLAQSRMAAGVAPPVQYQRENIAGGGILQVNPENNQATALVQPKDPLEAAKLSELSRHNRAIESNGAAGAGSGYDPDTIRTAAVVVASDPSRLKDYASYGKAGQQARTQINNEISNLKRETGMTDADFVRARVNAKAAGASVQKMTQQANQIEAFEGLAKANGQRVLDLLEKVDTTGLPMMEGMIRAAKREGGNVDAAELQSVLTTFQNETSRILSNPAMTGVVSDSARHEIQAMASGKMSSEQGKRVIKRLFTEMDLRKSLMQDQIDKAGGQSVVGAQPTPTAPASPAAAEVTATGPGGQKIALRNGQWVPLGN